MKNKIFVLFVVLFGAVLAQSLSAQDSNSSWNLYAQDSTQSQVNRRSSGISGSISSDTSSSDTTSSKSSASKATSSKSSASKATSSKSSASKATSSKSTSNKSTSKGKVASKKVEYNDDELSDEEYTQSLIRDIKNKRRSYGFLGFRLGFGSAEFLKYFSAIFSEVGIDTKSDLAVVPTIIGGYNWAINEYFDLKFYDELAYATYKFNSLYTSINLLDVSFNVDFSWRFFRNEIVDTGVFIGFKVDGGIWSVDLSSVVDIGFGMNIGADVVLFDHHGLRFDVYIPFVRTDSMDLSSYYGGSYGMTLYEPGVHFGIAYFYAF